MKWNKERKIFFCLKKAEFICYLGWETQVNRTTFSSVSLYELVMLTFLGM